MKLNEKKINEFFKIINEKKIKSVFQPIVSLKTGEIVSFEALSRITLKSCTLNIEELFKIANTIEQSWKLDQLCRKCAIKASQQMPLGKKLFINVDANILLDLDFVQGFTKEYLKKYHLDLIILSLNYRKQHLLKINTYLNKPLDIIVVKVLKLLLMMLVQVILI